MTQKNPVFQRGLIILVSIGISLSIVSCHAIKAGELVKNVVTATAADVVADEIQKHTGNNDCEISRGDLPIYDSEEDQIYCKKGDSY